MPRERLLPLRTPNENFKLRALDEEGVSVLIPYSSISNLAASLQVLFDGEATANQVSFTLAAVPKGTVIALVSGQLNKEFVIAGNILTFTYGLNLYTPVTIYGII